MQKSFAAAFGVGLAIIALAVGGIFLMQRNDRIDLPGKILKVRTAPLDEAPNRAPPRLGVGGRCCCCRRYTDRRHARNLGLTRKYVMSAKRLRMIYAVAVQRTTPCTTA